MEATGPAPAGARLGDRTLSEVAAGLRPYRPVVATLVVIVLLVNLLPGGPEPTGDAVAATGPGAGAPGTGTGPGATSGSGPAGAAPDATGDSGAAGGGAAGPAGGGDAASGGGTAGGPTVAPEAMGPNCDPATGRIRFPSVYAPPCVAPRANPGATYQGVTGDEIVVAIYSAQEDPAVSALLRAAGAEDSSEDVRQTYRDWAAMFQEHYETYGRRVRLEYVQASGDSDDDVAARADARYVANELRAFVAIGGPVAYADELAARGVVYIGQIARPVEFFHERAPFVWGTQMSGTEAFLHLAEYVGKRLAGRPARHAGDPAMHGTTRRIALVHLDTADGIYQPAVRFLEQELQRHGTALDDRIAYEPDINRAQEQARVVIARLQDRGITTVVFSGDPLAPVFFTQEASRQGYRPEWVIAGGSLVDTNFFGRTYDQRQWSRAFGISQLWIRPPYEQIEPYHQHVWHHGRPPRARASNEILYQPMWLLFTGIHMAGPDLNPATFRDGLFRYPPSGGGRRTVLQRSFGRHGLWPWDNYTAFDDVTEVWWDPGAAGEDEIGNRAQGMYRFVEDGRRYRPGEWPASEPRVFDPSIARTHFDELPESDRYPTYER